MIIKKAELDSGVIFNDWSRIFYNIVLLYEISAKYIRQGTRVKPKLVQVQAIWCVYKFHCIWAHLMVGRGGIFAWKYRKYTFLQNNKFTLKQWFF